MIFSRSLFSDPLVLRRSRAWARRIEASERSLPPSPDSACAMVSLPDLRGLSCPRPRAWRRRDSSSDFSLRRCVPPRLSLSLSGLTDGAGAGVWRSLRLWWPRGFFAGPARFFLALPDPPLNFLVLAVLRGLFLLSQLALDLSLPAIFGFGAFPFLLLQLFGGQHPHVFLLLLLIRAGDFLDLGGGRRTHLVLRFRHWRGRRGRRRRCGRRGRRWRSRWRLGRWRSRGSGRDRLRGTRTRLVDLTPPLGLDDNRLRASVREALLHVAFF